MPGASAPVATAFPPAPSRLGPRAVLYLSIVAVVLAWCIACWCFLRHCARQRRRRQREQAGGEGGAGDSGTAGGPPLWLAPGAPLRSAPAADQHPSLFTWSLPCPRSQLAHTRAPCLLAFPPVPQPRPQRTPCPTPCPS